MGKVNGLLYGIAINDADYITETRIIVTLPNGKRKSTITWSCPVHKKWTNMLSRCYSKGTLARSPTYRGCYVCKDWLRFSTFSKWLISQDWEGKQLDKDLLCAGNKEYSPKFCVLVDQQVNLVLGDNRVNRGEYPLGVTKNKHSYLSKIKVAGKGKHLGSFKDPFLAHQAWQKAKLEIVEDVANAQKDERVVAALMCRVRQLQDDILHNRETVKL